MPRSNKETAVAKTKRTDAKGKEKVVSPRRKGWPNSPAHNRRNSRNQNHVTAKQDCPKSCREKKHTRRGVGGGEKGGGEIRMLPIGRLGGGYRTDFRDFRCLLLKKSRSQEIAETQGEKKGGPGRAATYWAI